MEHKVEQCSATAHVDGAQGGVQGGVQDGVQGGVQDGAQDGAVQCCCPCRWYLWNTLPPSGSHAKWTRAAPVVIQISHQGKIFFSETSVMKNFQLLTISIITRRWKYEVAGWVVLNMLVQILRSQQDPSSNWTN